MLLYRFSAFGRDSSRGGRRRSRGEREGFEVTFDPLDEAGVVSMLEWVTCRVNYMKREGEQFDSRHEMGFGFLGSEGFNRTDGRSSRKP